MYSWSLVLSSAIFIYRDPDPDLDSKTSSPITKLTAEVRTNPVFLRLKFRPYLELEKTFSLVQPLITGKKEMNNQVKC